MKYSYAQRTHCTPTQLVRMHQPNILTHSDSHTHTRSHARSLGGTARAHHSQYEFLWGIHSRFAQETIIRKHSRLHELSCRLGTRARIALRIRIRSPLANDDIKVE